MPITYTNRKGVTYVLCRGTTPTGRVRYVFAREPRGEPVDALPAGYTIRESVNGVVSLARARPPTFSPGEIAVVEAAVRRHPQAAHFRVEARRDHIAVHERLGPTADDLLAGLGDIVLPLPGARARVEATLERSSQYAPVLRFRLVDVDRRTFGVERRWYSGGDDEWLPLEMTGPLTEVAGRVVPLLGTEAFFALW
jgi:hypothetical protein